MFPIFQNLNLLVCLSGCFCCNGKFDLDGYTPPTLDSKAWLIEACKVIKRNEAINKKETAKKVKKHPKKLEDNNFSNFFCTKHGHNTMHNMVAATC